MLTAGIYLAPIFMTLLSARVLQEPVGPRGWFGVLLGFAGALVLLQPGTEAFSAWAILPILGGLFYAIGHLITRVKVQGISSISLAFSYNLCMTSAAFVIAGLLWLVAPGEELARQFPFILSNWIMPTASLWMLLAAMGVLFAAIGVLLAGAYKAAPPSSVGTFEYSYLVFAIVWDIVFFETIPSVTTVFGIALIVAAGALVIGRHKPSKRG